MLSTNVAFHYSYRSISHPISCILENNEMYSHTGKNRKQFKQRRCTNENLWVAQIFLWNSPLRRKSLLLSFKNPYWTPLSCQNLILEMIFRRCALSLVNYDTHNIKTFFSNSNNMHLKVLRPLFLSKDHLTSLARRQSVARARHQRAPAPITPCHRGDRRSPSLSPGTET